MPSIINNIIHLTKQLFKNGSDLNIRGYKELYAFGFSYDRMKIIDRHNNLLAINKPVLHSSLEATSDFTIFEIC
jgi:hypothetical protein